MFLEKWIFGKEERIIYKWQNNYFSMVERTLVVDHLKLGYEGLFKASEVYNIISSFFYEKGWDWFEKLNQELVTPTGKQIKIVLEPWKSSSDYYKISMRIKLNMIDVREVEVEHEGQKVRLDHGVVRITFDGYVVPFFWFLSYMIEKYFFRTHYEKFETWIKSDVDDLHQKLKTYLNVYKYNNQY